MQETNEDASKLSWSFNQSVFLLGSNKRWFHSLAQNGMSGHRGGGTWLAHAMEPAMKASASTVNPTRQKSYGLPQRTETANESQGTAVESQSQGTDTPSFLIRSIAERLSTSECWALHHSRL